jgi:hypothetical protein
MKKIIIISILSLIFTYFPMNSVNAEVNFSGIEIFEMLNGSAKLKWGTNLDTRAEIWYGLDENNLNRFMGYSLYKRWHETVLTGLEREKTYYYKIKAIEESGETTETFIRIFSTDDMEDTVNPEFREGYPRFVQTTHTAVALKWKTNEDTKAIIRYGTDPDNLNKTKNYRKYVQWHDQFIYDLQPGEKYYFQVEAIDRDGNSKIKLVHKSTYTNGTSDLIVSNVEPLSMNSDLIGIRQVIIKWKTNLISKGLVYYGTNPKKLNDRVYTPAGRLNHEATIGDLLSNKTYYFKIKSYESLYNKSKTLEVMSFKTKTLDNQHKIGTLIKGSDSKVYVIRGGGEKSHIKDEKIFLELGYKWEMIKNISDKDLSEYKDTDRITSSKTHPDGTLIKYADKPSIYLIDGGKKRPFFTEEAFTRRGYNFDDVITIPSKKSYITGYWVF